MSGRVPPSSRAGKRTRYRTDDPQVKSAAQLYESFTGHKVKYGQTVNVPPLPKVVALIGPCDFVGYTTVRDGRTEKYIHKFAARDKPMLCASPDGTHILLVGGNYDFTERGIVDGSDKKTRKEMGIPW